MVHSPTALLVPCLLSAVTPAAPAADFAWDNATGGTWHTAATGPPGGVPGAADNALIALGGAYTVGLTGTQSVNNATLDAAGAGLRVGGTLNLGGTITPSAGVRDLASTADTPAGLSGGTVTAGVGGTGRLRVTGVGRLADVAVATVTVHADGTARRCGWRDRRGRPPARCRT